MNPADVRAPLSGQTLGSIDNSFVIAEWKDPGGVNPPLWIAPLHRHHRDDEAWYVLDGTLGLRVGDEDLLAHAGTAVMVARGTPHTYWNAGSGELRYLLVMTANIHALIEEIHAMKDRSPEAMRAVFERHDSELL
jgi:mannose-6-phosphate isomerase-like protein (cupin superfamily)